jgi:hypothetical protein
MGQLALTAGFLTKGTWAGYLNGRGLLRKIGHQVAEPPPRRDLSARYAKWHSDIGPQHRRSWKVFG